MKIFSSSKIFAILFTLFLISLNANNGFTRPGGGSSFSTGGDDDNSSSSYSSSSSSSSSSSYSYDDDDDDYDYDYDDDDDDYSSSSSSSGEDTTPWITVLILFGLATYSFLVIDFIQMKKVWWMNIGAVLFTALMLTTEWTVIVDNEMSHWWFVVNILLLVFILATKIMNFIKSSTKVVSSKASPAKQTIKKKVKLKSEYEKLVEKDLGFSKVLFLDFVSSLYHEYYHKQGTGEFNDLKVFLDERILSNVSKQAASKNKYSEIVIGTINIDAIESSPTESIIVLKILSNYTLSVQGKSTRYEVSEKWLMSRKPNVVTPEPEKMQQLSCPNCGAPVKLTNSGECTYCSTVVKNGDMQWYLKDIFSEQKRSFTVQSIAHYTIEAGTNLPTVFDEKLKQNLLQFWMDNKLDFSKFLSEFKNSIVKNYFFAIYESWTNLEWHKVRHLLSDRLYASNNYWIEAYKSEGLQNKLTKLKLNDIELVKIETDKYYESITVRLKAECYDYIENKKGKRIGGSKRQKRKFSEYWTFVEYKGLAAKIMETDSVNLFNCPSCGAEATQIGEAGVCKHCDSKISTGKFSWVLSSITQDEVYKG